jgi:hypothetical protein
MLLETFRNINLAVHTFCLSITVFMGLFKPKKTNIKSEEYSIRNGHSKFIIILVRIFQYYTVFSHIFLISALCTNKQELFVVAHIYQSTLFVLYYGLIWVDVEYLAHIENFPNRKFLQSIVSWYPPLKFPEIFMWIMLNTQHLFAPLYIWIESYFYSTIVHDGSLLIEINALFVLYGFWNFYCWYVQGFPVYPIQKFVYDKGLEYAVLFYITCIIILNTVAIGCDYLL